MRRIDRLLARHGSRAAALAIVLWAGAILGIFAGLWRFHAIWLAWGLGTVVFTALVIQWTNYVRERFIREAPLPRFLQRKLREKHPHLGTKDCELVERGLRQFFLACMRHRKQFVAMPSQVVDDLWHEFILHTQAYQRWCDDALGYFLHHTPAEALGTKARHNDGLRRAWYWACKEESINPKTPSRLPLLFALDAKLNIPGGFHYQPNSRLTAIATTAPAAGCGTGDTSPHYGTHFSDASYSGSSTDFGGAESADAGSDGGSDGGGCGGGGD